MVWSSRSLALCGALALIAAGCGGGGSADGDGGLEDGRTPDAGIDGGGVSCEAASVIDRAPDQATGDLGSATADLGVDDSSCASVVAPFGVQALGPDEVVELRNLIPGSDYAVRLVSAEDLAFYVGAGCASAGDTIDGCLLYVDSSTGNIEVGRFTAPGNGRAVVVVDHWDAEAPVDGSYGVEVYPVECDEGDASACAGSTPICLDYRCASCDDAFDCTSASTPVCDPVEDRCVPGVDACDSDDAGEPGDDGPAGARDITPPGAGTASIDGKICNAPAAEYDFYRFDVAANGESYLIELLWSASGVDLDMEVMDDAGRSFGLSLFERPETIQLTHLPAGTYYVQINYSASSQITTPVDYTLRATRGAADPCGSVADCAVEYRNQGFRSICSAGACELRIGDGSLAEAAVCDSDPDCQSGVCASFPFTADSDTRSLCTRGCSSDAQCAGLGADWVCTTYLASNECVRRCTADEQCPISLSFLPQSGPWFRLTCNVPTGKCTF